MGLEKIGTTVNKEITSWTRTSGNKKLFTTGLTKINAPSADCFQKINSNTEIPKKKYINIVKNMIAQRANMVNTVDNGSSIEFTLGKMKDNYVGVNKDIRSKIMKSLGDESAYYDASSFKKKVQNLDKLIAQGYLPTNTVLYRGASPYDFGMRNVNCNEFVEKFYKKGRLFKIPIYPETTLDKKVGKKFAENRILFKINAPKGTPGIYMEKLGLPKSGNYNNEEEILLPRNLIFRFKSHVKEKNYDLIELDIVQNKPFWKKIHEFWNEI